MDIELHLLGLLGLLIHYLKDWEQNNREGKKYTIGKALPTFFLSLITTQVLIYLHKDIEALYVVTPFAAVVLGYLGNSVFFSFVTAKKPSSVVMASGDNGSREAIWFEKFSDFPQQGDETKLYYDASTDEYYYWTGTMYARWVGPRPPKPPKPPL